jgi:cyclopropane-fatty-acyl-phospholipid synthase
MSGVDARDVCVGLLARAGVTVDGTEPWSMRVHDERVWERLVRDRELGIGESYMDGWWDCDRVDEMLVRVLDANLRDEIRPTPKLLAIAAKSIALNRQTVRRARRNAHHHYDIGNDLYSAMLDRRMVYSCGYWRAVDTLDAAQEAKLDLVCRKLHLEPGMRLLDIGCGWGAFVQFATERYGVQAVGISPAGEQVAYCRAHLVGTTIEIRQTDYREVSGTFDRITSIGMMEHVGPRNLQAFFRACDRLLAPGGLMLHHTIGVLRTKNYTNPWIDKYIFPGGILPSLAQLARGAETRWVTEDVHNFGPDYDRTLMAWHANIEAKWAELPARYDERFRRMWRFYLLSCAAAFRARQLQLWQVVYRRVGQAEPYQPVR